MIFVTIGTVLPFDRLIKTMDEWAEKNQHHEFLAQIGNGEYEPKHMKWVRRITQAEYAPTVERADIMVSHAGMGSVITAGRFGVPVAMMPRLLKYNEVNTEHQVASAKWLRDKNGVFVADTEAELGDVVAKALAMQADGQQLFSRYADASFTDALRAEIMKD